jgi:DNA-directed RNA polymerase specialized sigma24 family protein
VSHPDPTDRQRFEALYRAHYGAVLRYAARRSAAGAAEEVAAETFATARRRLDHVPRDEPLPWLLVTARNTLANTHRSATRTADKEREHAATVAEPRTRDPAEALAERDAVVHAFPALSEPAARRCASSPGTGSRTPPPRASPASPADCHRHRGGRRARDRSLRRVGAGGGVRTR